ncbi:MAG TPA: alpha/beta fold hydrolase [Casimicrobiaceae bacterium]|nr:alpha/beta fold hydrolase [Casimicrobiaceae bacterium]
MKRATSHHVALRGLVHHVLTWGDPAAPKLFLLHGWMDVAASFQFLVDAFARDWHAIAPDWRGFGRSEWQPQGYWFPDYIADLEALLDAFAPGERVDLVGHSLGGNVVMLYAGARPARVRRVVSLEGFGIPREDADRAPAKIAAWLDALAAPPEFASYANLDAVADRLQKNNARLPRDKTLFLAGHWAETAEDGRARLVSDPRHKLPFPTTYRVEEAFAVWRNVTAPTLWVAAADSSIPKWLDDHPEGEAGADGLDGIRRRMSHLRDARLVVVPDASHMLHHDQPAKVAAAVEAFLAAPAPA